MRFANGRANTGAMHEDDPSDRIGELIRYGTVDSVDLATGKCTIKIGDIITQPVRWAHGAAGGSGGTSIWAPPIVGEQVILLAPEGDVTAAIALTGVHSDANPPAGNSARALIRFADGALIAYDPEAHLLDVTLPDGATVNIVATGGVTIDAETVTITGDLQVGGKITADGDVTGEGTSLHNHKHTGVTPGAAQTGKPA